MNIFGESCQRGCFTTSGGVVCGSFCKETLQEFLIVCSEIGVMRPVKGDAAGYDKRLLTLEDHNASPQCRAYRKWVVTALEGVK